MNCTCDYFGDNGEPVSCPTIRWQKARKRHKCDECMRTIEPGEEYENYKGVSDGEWFVHKTCLGCARIRKQMFKHPPACGFLHEAVEECTGVDIVHRRVKS